MVYVLLGVLIISNIYYASYSVLVGEIHFFNDVARDFLLLREIDAKKIMLIGPRSNASGLFHGPLWSYVNYPAYRLGGGNPIVVGWFWIFLEMCALGIGFIGAKRLFGSLAALVYTFLYSTLFITHINGMFHSDAPVFLTPLFFFSILLYEKYKAVRYLVIHFFILAMIIQLNFGVGTPLLILSTLIVVFLILKNKLRKHLVTFLIIPILLSNFIIFDIRHDHLLINSAYANWQFTKTWNPLPLSFRIKNRLEETTNLHVIQNQNPLIIWVIFAIVLVYTVKEIKPKSKYKTVYLVLTYFYFGYMALTFINKGVILSHFVYLFGPLTTLWFASFVRGHYQKKFLLIFVFIAVVNIRYGQSYVNYVKNSLIEKLPWSWRSTNQVAQAIINRQGQTPFGYFVFSPDAFAYGPRYAMIYHFKPSGAQAFEYEKKPTTYIVASPPPENDPYMTHVWWRKNPVRITSDPVWTQKFPSGYTIEQFQLTQEEQLSGHDKTIELGIHFR